MAAEEDALRGLARSSGLSRREIRTLIDLEAVQLSDRAGGAELIRRLRRVRRLRRDVGLSLDAAVIVLRLMERIEALQGVSAPRVAVRVRRPPGPAAQPVRAVRKRPGYQGVTAVPPAISAGDPRRALR